MQLPDKTQRNELSQSIIVVISDEKNERTGQQPQNSRLSQDSFV